MGTQRMSWLEDFFLLVISVSILAVTVRILLSQGAIAMNFALSLKIAGLVGFLFFAGLSAFAWKVLRKEKLAIRFATMAVPCFAMMAIINDW